MSTSFQKTSWRLTMTLAAILGGLSLVQPLTALAQAAETAAETPASLPHGRFLLDYLLVALLLAGALYAVCRSSRRV